MTNGSPNFDFLVRLRKIDRQRLTARDMIVLWGVKHNPGIMGKELATKLGYPSRSHVQEHVARLIRHGFVEDRRHIPPGSAPHMIPNDLHITAAGEDFLGKILPV